MTIPHKTASKNTINMQNCKPESVILGRTVSFKNFLLGNESQPVQDCVNRNACSAQEPTEIKSPLDPKIFSSPRPISELNAAAVTVQKIYKSYRTRRNLADCAVVVEELWWKAIDFAALRHSSVSFYKDDKPETVGSRWARAKTRVAKVGKGLSKDEKAQKLALQHWLEAIDPRHRYGHNLHIYYDVWFASESTQPFFFWLDVGLGKDVNLEKCPRSVLQKQCIKYLGPNEREEYEVAIENGRLMYKKSGSHVNTEEGSKWIFVLSTSRAFYVGQKKKGVFQHSSFLSGAAITAAGRLVAHDGILEAIWPYSGHYLPTEENFKEFINFLEEHHVDLTNVKRCSVDDDYISSQTSDEKSLRGGALAPAETSQSEEAAATITAVDDMDDETKSTPVKAVNHEESNVKMPVPVKIAIPPKPPVFDLAKRLSCKWSTGTGPRINCVRDYPPDLQSQALEQVKLSPRVTPRSTGSYGPIPSPRPSPNYRVSPRLSNMGLPSPRTPITAA